MMNGFNEIRTERKSARTPPLRAIYFILLPIKHSFCFFLFSLSAEWAATVNEFPSSKNTSALSSTSLICHTLMRATFHLEMRRFFFCAFSATWPGIYL